MAKMIVRLYTTLKDKIGTPRIEIEADDVAQAIQGLQEKYPDVINATLVDSNGVVRNHFTLTLNSQILDPHKITGVSVKDGDMLHVFPPIAGGQGSALYPPPQIGWTLRDARSRTESL